MLRNIRVEAREFVSYKKSVVYSELAKVSTSSKATSSMQRRCIGNIKVELLTNCLFSTKASAI